VLGSYLAVCVSLSIAVLFCAIELALILRVASVCVKKNKQRKKVKASPVELCCLHTYLHTSDNCLLSGVNIEGFLSVFSHNPLVPGSSPGGPTTVQTPVRNAGGFFIPLNCFITSH